MDLHTLVSQFTGLRQEVNLQTKSSRSALEQNAVSLEGYRSSLSLLEETLDDLRASQESASETKAEEALKPVFKGIIDVYDALALALRQVTRQRDTLHQAFQSLEQTFTIEPPPKFENVPPVQAKRGFWSRMFGVSTAADNADRLQEWYNRVSQEFNQRHEKVKSTTTLFGQALEGLITGYTMSLNRIERLLPLLSLEPIVSVGQPFNPETMEVVDVATGTGRQAGEVIEEVRRGYHRLGQIYRYAQVRVAK